MSGSTQNNMSAGYLVGSDFHLREQRSLRSACSKTGFALGDLVGKSSWWGSDQFGASFYSGEFKGKKAILKIQGVKPHTSEAEMIAKFQQANKSKMLRPPHLYAHLPWDEKEQYEGLILEWVGREKVLSKPVLADELNSFFNLYDDYRKNCTREPWVVRGREPLPELVMRRFSEWIEVRERLYPNHPLYNKEDNSLILEAVHLLCREYEGVALTFQHGHFSRNDLYRVGEEVVLLSNLYWSWRAPFFDRVFAYHWFMYELSDVPGITPEAVAEQKTLWLKAIDQNIFLPEDRRLLRLAKLERAVAGLNLDALSINPKKKISKYLVESTRKDVVELMEVIEKRMN